MKKAITLLVICSFIASPAFSQKCKEIVDPITNEKKVVFKKEDAWHWLTLESNKGVTTLSTPIYYQSVMNIAVPAGTPISFKLENGDVITLKTVSESLPKFSVGTTGHVFTMEVSKENLQKFAASPLVLIRVPNITDSGYLDLQKKDMYAHVKKRKGPLKKGAACMTALTQ